MEKMLEHAETFHFLGAMAGIVPHRTVLSCPGCGTFSLFCVEGGGVLEQESGAAQTLPKECVLTVPAGQTPVLSAGETPLRVRQLIVGGVPPFAGCGDTPVFAPETPGDLPAMFAALTEHLPAADEDARLREFFGALTAKTHPLPSGGTSVPESIRTLKTILDTRYAEKLTLDSLAGELHWNKYKLDKDFKRCYGRSPFEYLLDVRVREACRLLRETNLSVLDVGFAVGVDNASYFVRLFKRRTGLSPLAYRRPFT